MAAGTEGVEVGTVLARLRIQGSEAGDNVHPMGSENSASDASILVTSTAAPVGNSSELHPTPVYVSPDRILASPYARKRAADSNISLRNITGSGPGGRIVSRDFPSTNNLTTSTLLESPGYAPESFTLTPASKMRRAIAENLAGSVAEIPHFSLTANAELDAALTFRKARNAELGNDVSKISINDLIIWACSRALAAVPAANSSWVENGIATHQNANIAVAVALDDGLVAPVIRAADAKSLHEISAASRDLIQRAKAGQLTTRDLQGATFTVSNLGMLGVTSFTSILSKPQACILSVGAVEERPVARYGKITIATQATLTLTCDHRVVDGAVGATLLAKLREFLESPSG